jgi:hypothetical protein
MSRKRRRITVSESESESSGESPTESESDSYIPPSRSSSESETEPEPESEPEPEPESEDFEDPLDSATKQLQSEVYLQTLISRATRESFYIVPQPIEFESTREFRVLGPGDQEQNVQIGISHNCDCPSSILPCEHILAVLLIIFKIPHNSSYLRGSRWNPRYLARLFADYDQLSEEEIHSLNIHSIHSLHTEHKITVTTRREEKRVLNPDEEPLGQQQDQSSLPKQKEWKLENKCPICFDPMIGFPLIWCKEKYKDKTGCGNTFHLSCAKSWLKVSKKKNCPLCRIPWVSSLPN